MPFLRLPIEGGELAVEWSGDGPALVFAHGLTGTRGQSQRLVGALETERRVITFDQRGHGASGVAAGPRTFDPRAMAGDIISVLDTLDIERAALGGASMGAATALLAALAHPERVTHLVLTAPAFGDLPNPGSGVLAAIGDEIAAAGIESYISRLRGQDWPALGMTEEAMDFRAGMLRSHDPALVAAACHAVSGWVILDDLTPLARLNIPTLIIAWHGDLVHTWELAERYAAALPNAQLLRTDPQPYYNEPGFVARLARPFLGSM